MQGDAAAMYGEYDDEISEWHMAGPGHPAHGIPLHEWLGMTWEQYVEFMSPRRLLSPLDPPL